MKLKSSFLIILISGLLAIVTVLLIKEKNEKVDNVALSSTKNEIVFRSVTEKEYQAASPFIKKLIDNTLQSDISIIFESTTNKQYLDDKFRNGYISEKLIDNLLIGKPFIHASMLVNDFLNNNGFNNYSDILEIDYNDIFSDIENINDRLIIHIKRLAKLSSIDYDNIINKLKIVAETNRQKCLELFEKNTILEDIVNNKI